MDHKGRLPVETYSKETLSIMLMHCIEHNNNWICAKNRQL